MPRKNILFCGKTLTNNRECGKIIVKNPVFEHLLLNNPLS